MRAQRTKQAPGRLVNFKLLPNSNESEFFHFSMLVDIEVISYDKEMKSKVLRKAMIEELKTIEKSDI